MRAENRGTPERVRSLENMENRAGCAMVGVPSVRLCDRFAPRRLGSATTIRSGVSNEIEPVNLVGY